MYTRVGAVATVMEGGIRIEADDDRKSDNAERIVSLLCDGHLAPDDAAYHRGILSFPDTLDCGEVGGAMLLPLSRRQYDTAMANLTTALGAFLTWRMRAIPGLMARCAPFDFLSPSVCTPMPKVAAKLRPSVALTGTRLAIRYIFHGGSLILRECQLWTQGFLRSKWLMRSLR